MGFTKLGGGGGGHVWPPWVMGKDQLRWWDGQWQ